MVVVTTVIANSAIGLQPARTISEQLLQSSNHWARRHLAGYYYIFQLLTKKISWVPWGHPITVVKLLKAEAIRKNYSKKALNPKTSKTNTAGNRLLCCNSYCPVLQSSSGYIAATGRSKEGLKYCLKKAVYLFLLRICKKLECLNLFVNVWMRAVFIQCAHSLY